MNQLIEKITQSWVSPEQLDGLKLQFRREIDSPRLLARILTLDELLYVLEQRDVLTEINLQPLEKICHELRNNELIAQVQNCKYLGRNAIIDGANTYASVRIMESVANREPQRRVNTDNSRNNSCYDDVDSKKSDKIYKLIASDIGRKWREFGRSLGIKEGEMDILDNQFPKDFKSKVYGLFKLLEEDEGVEGRRKYVVILNALNECRRSDLRRKTDEILNS